MAGVSMKDIKLRIRSMESTKQITKAMEMVAASKLRRAQDNAQRSRPYFVTLYDTMNDIAANNRDFSSPYMQEREVKRSLYIVIAGDRGLAGGYNHNVLKLAESHMAGKNVVVYPIGKKAFEDFTAHGYELYSGECREAANISISTCFTIARSLCKDFLSGEFDEVYIAYTNFVSILTQNPAVMPLLPLRREELTSAVPTGPRTDTIYEPDSSAVFDKITPEYLGGLIYGALCESVASEQGARRTAMESATKNAEEMIGDLNLKYNRARQGAITQEITEIIAGADA